MSDVSKLLGHIWGTGWHDLCSGLGRNESFRTDGSYDDPEALLDAAEALNRQRRNVWFGVHPMAEQPASGRRGSNAGAAEVRVIVADLDWLDTEAHDDAELLTEPEVRDRLASFAIPPNVVICSGHGLQPWWVFDSSVDVAMGTDLITRLHGALDALGLKPDRADLASVLRVPGSINWKKATPVEVVVEHDATATQLFVPEWLDRQLPGSSGRRSTGTGTRSSGGVVAHGDDAVVAQLRADNREQDADALAVLMTVYKGHHPWIDRDGCVKITRPGKKAGNSATVGHIGPGIVKVFSANWPTGNGANFAEKGRYGLTEAGDALELLEDVLVGSISSVATELTTEAEHHDEEYALPGVDGLRYTDAGNAIRLIRKHGDLIRFVPIWKRWVVYANGRWRLDHADTLVAHLAAGLGNDLLTYENIRKAESHPDPKQAEEQKKALIRWGTRTENRTGVQGTLDAAATVPGVALDHETIDAEPWLLNVGNGTINLRTGELGPHTARHLLMMQTPVRYDERATCPQFEQFLELVLPDDEVRRFVQRLFGLALVGEQVEHILPIAIGGGANGKSTLTKIIARVFGDYSVVVSKNILLALKNTVHDTSKATLFRRRLAYAGELPPDASLNEAQVKELTGGDRITARRMREDEWTFDPTHTLWLHANYRPRISGTDDGIWRRVKLIPFEVQVPPDRQDPDLARRIIAEESAGLLNWLLAGLAEYRQIGLATPERVKVATATYRNESDTVAAFLAEAGLVIDPALTTSTGDLLQLHNEWFTAYGIGDTEKAHYQQVVEALKVRGVTSARTSSKGRFWRGIGRGGDNG